MPSAPLCAHVPPSGLQTEMHRLIDELDWAATSVGPRHTWSRSLTSTIKLLLGSRYPIILLWGPELIQIYNEAYMQLIGDKHPAALGRSIRATQAEAWGVIGPTIHEVMSTGIPSWVPAQCLPLQRAGYREESYFSLSYSAVEDDRGDISGVLCLCSEVTEQVLGERRRAGETRERERAESMLRFLADASATLAESLDYPVTMARIARLSVPILADWCFIDIVDELGSIERVEVAHADPADAAHARAIKAFPAATSGNRDNPPTRAVLEGRAVLLQDVDDAQLRASSHSQEHLAVMRALGVRSFMSVPLEARGRTLGCLSLATSKSGRRYSESDLALAQDLARRCALAVDNARLYAEAQRAVSARDQFLSIASHELKTPLTPLSLQLHTLARKVGEVAKDEQAREWLAAKIALLQRQSMRLDRIVNELLDVTRIAGAQLRLVPERLDIKELAEGVLAGFERSGELQQSRCQLDFRAEQAVVGYWDRHLVEQVIRHLLENAIKFGAGKPVELVLARRGRWARLTVSDHGLGIALEDQARIFDRFERAVPERHYGGLGLGLWLVRSTVDAMGGSVTVQSTPKKGATFIVELPIGEAP